MNGTELGCREVICSRNCILEVLLSTIRDERFSFPFFLSDLGGMVG